METPQKRQKSWLSSLTGLVSGTRNSATETSSDVMSSKKSDASATNSDIFSARLRTARADTVTPSRYSGTFSAPPVESPDSSPKRASPTLLAQRKIHERAQGPSSRLGVTSSSGQTFPSRSINNRSVQHNNPSHTSTTPRRTNFSSAATPKNMFRDSVSRDTPAFTFTPRVQPSVAKGHASATTPARSFRGPSLELGSRDISKTSSSDLFAMKIPDPDPKLSGEAISNMVPKHFQTSGRSVYANEYLAHLCPPDFSEEQRNQFFCILDLRRLKYAADEVFLKKDWRLNILNFAKEYEKNRSLIMLRYGLYEFKTVKVSKDVFQKWKADNNIPDLDEDHEMVDNTTGNGTAQSKTTTAEPKAPRLNGTEGILRTEKRKAQDSIDPSTIPASASTSNKRARPFESSKPAERVSERGPLTETRTPALNKSKRRTADPSGSEQFERSKLQKAAIDTSSTTTPSATRALFEKVTNSPTPENAFMQTSKSSVDDTSTSKPALFNPAPIGQSARPSSGSLARSILSSGLKASSEQGSANIFGYLSDASSAKGSGNGNAEADAEDTEESDGQEEQDEQIAPEALQTSGGNKSTTNGMQPKTASSLFSSKPLGPVTGIAGTLIGSSASSEASEPAPGRSLFDRVNKTRDGQPIRMFGADGTNASLAAPAFGSKPASGDSTPAKEPTLFGANKTWNPDTPIKFAGNSTTGSTTTGSDAIGKNTNVQATPLFGAATGSSSTVNITSSTPSLFATAASKKPVPGTLFGSTINGASAPQKESTSAKEEPKSSNVSDTLQPSAPVLFGFSNKGTSSSTSTTPSLFGSSTPLFGKPQEQQPASTVSQPLFGSATTGSNVTAGPVLQSQALFGSTPKLDAQLPGLKRSADNSLSTAATSTPPPLFGSALKKDSSAHSEPQAKKPFGSGSAFLPHLQPSSGANGATEQDKPAQEPAKFLFGANTNSTTEPSKAGTNTLFGSSMTPAGVATPIFSFGSTAATATTAATANNNNSSSSSTGLPVESASSSFTFGAPATQQQGTISSQAITPQFGNVDTASAPSSFTFNVGGGNSQSFHNPFTSGDSGTGTQPAPTPSFGSNQSGNSFSTPFHFGAGASSAPAPVAGSASFSFGAGTQPTSQPSGTAASFSFGAGTVAQPSSMPLFGQQQSATGGPIFNLAPPVGGTSTGTNTPFTLLGGASSLASTPATGTPEPGATQDNSDHNGHQADGDEAPQEQINLTEGGPGEEDEAVVYEVRAKALKLVTPKNEAESGSSAATDKKSPWKTEGVGPLRLLKHKTTGTVRLLLRGEPRGNVALNRVLLPDFQYKPEPNAKYVKLTTANEFGNGLETWMLQVKTKDAAQALAKALEENKLANKK